MTYKAPTTNRVVFIVLCAVLSFGSSFGQSAAQKKKIKTSYSSSKIRSITSRLENDFKNSITKTARLAKANNWKISERLPNGGYVELQDVGPDGTPLYYTTLTETVSTTSRANTMYKDGFLGLGIHGEGMNVGIWDAGIALTTHQEFVNRVDILDTESKIESHATMVTSALVSSGIRKKAQGVAYKANAITGDWAKDKIEVTRAAENGLLLSNHSYGIQTDRVPDWYFGSYIKVSQDWDVIMYNAPFYLMVTAAGNAQKQEHNDTPFYGKNTQGFDLLLGFNTSKNGIVVAAANTEIDKNGGIEHASVTGYSSLGPVDDGRIKPDLAGSGSSAHTASATGDKTYTTCTGTSIAAPGITGSLLLLQQYNERLYGSFMKAATLKGLALHTADDVNAPGPDYKMGWGIMNTKKAAQTLTNKDFSTIVSEVSLQQGESYAITVNASEAKMLSASISWTDAAGAYVNRGVLNNVKAALTNDLDIRITKNGKTFLPWKLDAAKASSKATKGDNKVDPFERIDLSDTTGEYTVIVSHKGTLYDGKQDFTLIITGIAVTGCSASTPSSVKIVEPTNSIVPIVWAPVEDAIFEVQYKAENEDNWNTSYTNKSNIELENLKLEQSYEVRLRTVCTENIGSDYTEVLTFMYQGDKTRFDIIIGNETLSLNDKIKFLVYPNPAVEQITIQGNIAKASQYTVISTTGATIKKGDAKNNSRINVSDLSTGVYILSVYGSKNVQSTKFYKI